MSSEVCCHPNLGDYLLDAATKTGKDAGSDRVDSKVESGKPDSTEDRLSAFFKVFGEKFRSGDIRFDFAKLGKHFDRFFDKRRVRKKKPSAKRLK